MNLLHFPKVIFRGFSQVMLQDNAITGLLFFIGILYNSGIMAVGAAIGAVASTWTAYLLDYPKKDIENGLYGFNGVLVGIALTFFFQFNLILDLIIVAAAAFSSVTMRLMRTTKVPPFTFPFIAAAWIFYAIIAVTGIAGKNVSGAAPLTAMNVFNSAANGIGQVMFQENVVTGLIFLAAILVSSRMAAMYALAGTLIGFAAAAALGLNSTVISAGIFGFNAVLCGIAFAKTSLKSVLPALLAIILSVFIALLLLRFNLPMLTFPFVLATWITLLIGKALTNFKKKAGG